MEQTKKKAGLQLLKFVSVLLGKFNEAVQILQEISEKAKLFQGL